MAPNAQTPNPQISPAISSSNKPEPTRPHKQLRSNRGRLSQQLMKVILTCLVTLIIVRRPTVDALWIFKETKTTTLAVPFASSARASAAPAIIEHPKISPQAQQQTVQETSDVQQQSTPALPSVSSGGSGISYANFGNSLMSIAGIQPSSLASVFNTVGDAGFSYFNIQNQCRNRAACDLGNLLYKRLSFVHNWLIRTSVRSLTDMNNAYTQSWMEGMLGRNCSAIYATCQQSPLEGLMSLAYLQHLAV